MQLKSGNLEVAALQQPYCVVQLHSARALSSESVYAGSAQLNSCRAVGTGALRARAVTLKEILNCLEHPRRSVSGPAVVPQPIALWACVYSAQ